MPTVREIEQRLYAAAPKELAFPWDNVGHLLGDPEQSVTRVLVALDVTEAVADEAIAEGVATLSQRGLPHRLYYRLIWAAW